MHRTEPPMIVIAVCLAGLAGFVDALAFTSLGGFFASFMSGNTTRLGVGLGTGNGGVAMTAGALILSFVSGVILASVVARMAGRRYPAAVMTVVTLLLFLAAIVAAVAPGPIVLLLLASAMGVENGVFNRDGEVSIGLTYMTGSLVRMGQKLGNALMGDADRWDWVPYLALWLGFAAGVVFGAASQLRWGWDALWLAGAVSTALTVALARLGRRAA
ncbi:YoaK family protein [Sphingomonas sp. M1-B02]|uniref:YoaK family protein n=1 Tax=Sphingomonas sp. M1-B02 TaxID=3114300 RepID=UPI002240A7FC|nr:YoaK family protein [Sphingomonas sp. S6-11]UZK65678.1 YoaK family protein [Sphingomonas sp. S6-11]